MIRLKPPREGFHAKGRAGFSKKEEEGSTYSEDVLLCLFAGMISMQSMVFGATITSKLFPFSFFNVNMDYV